MGRRAGRLVPPLASCPVLRESHSIVKGFVNAVVGEGEYGQRMDPNEPVEVATFFSRFDADVARAHLESVGIKAFVQADDAGGTYAGLEAARAKVFVRAQDLAEAQEELEISA